MGWRFSVGHPAKRLAPSFTAPEPVLVLRHRTNHGRKLWMARTAADRWLDTSIAATRGVGWARKPTLHALTEAVQGKFHYTIGPYSDPVLQVEPGDRVRIETRDAFEGAIRTESDKPTERLHMPFVNPQNGPIMVADAEPGDAISVHIESMLPRGENPRGTSCMIPHFGALTGTTLTAALNTPLPQLYRYIHIH